MSKFPTLWGVFRERRDRTVENSTTSLLKTLCGMSVCLRSVFRVRSKKFVQFPSMHNQSKSLFLEAGRCVAEPQFHVLEHQAEVYPGVYSDGASGGIRKIGAVIGDEGALGRGPE